MSERITKRKDVTYTVTSRLLFEIRDLLESLVAASKRSVPMKVAVRVQGPDVTAAREALATIAEYRGEPSASHAWDSALRDIAREALRVLATEPEAVQPEATPATEVHSESRDGEHT